MALPIQTPEQLAATLLLAQAARAARKEALARLTDGTVTLANALDDGSPALQRAFVRQVLRALPGVGPATAAKVMAEIGIGEKRRVSGLGPNQRRALVGRFATADA